jgi:6-phosphogluconolactonase
VAISPDQRMIYVGLRARSQIAALHIEPGTGELLLQEEIALNADPCYLATDRSGRVLFASYYGAGQVTAHAIQAGGGLDPTPLQVIPTAERAHCIQTDPTNRFAFVPHTAGPNLIFQFDFDPDTGMLAPNSEPKINPEPGIGPRHFVFHPDLPMLYFSNEQGCSVTAYRLDGTSGRLSPLQTLSTLPSDFSGDNSCAQIHLTPDGRFLYVANRGHDSLAIYAVDPGNGLLAARGWQLTEPVPRAFGLDPDGRFLYVAGLGSGRLAGYDIDPQSGALSPLDTYEVGERPMWVAFLSDSG